MPQRPPSAAERRFLVAASAVRPALLARVATVDAAGLPHVVPTVWRYDAATGDVLLTGRSVAGTARARNVEAHPFAAVVVDGAVDGPDWQPWGITLRGPARVDADAGAIRVTPTHVTSWGLDAAALPGARTVA